MRAHLEDLGGAAAADALQLGVARAAHHDAVLVLAHAPHPLLLRAAAARQLPAWGLLPCPPAAALPAAAAPAGLARRSAPGAACAGSGPPGAALSRRLHNPGENPAKQHRR